MQVVEIQKRLHALIHTRLLESDQWLADEHEVAQVETALEDLGLWRRRKGVNGEVSWCATPLGKEFQVDLLIAFLGILDELAVPMTLEEYGLIDEAALDLLYDPPDGCTDNEILMRPVVMQAYFDWCNSTSTVH